MENETCFTIPDGFLIIHREQTVDIATAEKWLCTKRQRKYTSALRVGDSAILKKDLIKCPYCGRETPAYVRFLSDSLKWIPWWQRPKVTTISKSAIREWASPQYSLMCSTTLELNPIYFPVEGFTCPQCGAESEAGQVSLSVRLRREKKQLSVSCGPLFLDELLILGKEIIVKKEELSFPFTESIVFNFSNGHVFFQIIDVNDTLAAIYDISDFNHEWAGSALHKVLTSTIGRKKLFRAFRKNYGPDFPFSEERYTFNRLIALTRFQHYPECFYDTIPTYLKSGCMGDGFKGIGRRMRQAGNLPMLYAASTLPQVKSIRRHFFTRPGLFFYLREAEQMWNIFNNSNYFDAFLRQENGFAILATLHQSPELFAFFRDVKRIKGVKSLLKVFLCGWYDINTPTYGARYLAMAPSTRKKMQQRWKKNKFYIDEKEEKLSVPAPTPGSQKINECSIGPYSFSLLRNTQEYWQAGQALKNCLRSIYIDSSTLYSSSIIVVKSGLQYKAAIEVIQGEVIQVAAAHNRALDTEPALLAAVRYWVELNGLKAEAVL